MTDQARIISQTVGDSEAMPLRIVTVASLFDGHDAAINIMRRLIQSRGVEVIHLGHNRSVDEVVRAVLQEDADAVAVSSYQGGHVEYFSYLVDSLKRMGRSEVKVFGGGGGTITLDEIAQLEAYGVERIYHPNDGMNMGLEAMIDDLVERTWQNQRKLKTARQLSLDMSDGDLAHSISLIEQGEQLNYPKRNAPALVLGMTGTGGAGKSTVTDELLSRFLQYFPEIRIAMLAVDPTRRKTGGALLGDRIRMNALKDDRIFMRSLATRRQNLATNALLKNCIDLVKNQAFDLVLVETAGIGQSDSEIVDLVDQSIYVMTSEYGAASQLEKIDMLDFADWIVLNKSDRRGSDDALRDIRKQWRRNRVEFDCLDKEIPVFPTIASQFNDPGMNHFFSHILSTFQLSNNVNPIQVQANEETPVSANIVIPPERIRYLSEISEKGRSEKQHSNAQAEIARNIQHIWQALKLVDVQAPEHLKPIENLSGDSNEVLFQLQSKYNSLLAALSEASIKLLEIWPEKRAQYQAEQYEYAVRNQRITGKNYNQTLSGLDLPKVAVPQTEDWGEQLYFMLEENVPGCFPFTAGVFPYRRTSEDPIRMFAGEGTPERTNRRFHYLADNSEAKRLSTAFDSVTLYGENPDVRPDIYGKVGNSGVSVAHLDDMKKLYSGFDLCAPNTSVSMTINGPAPIILAMFMNTAIDQQVEKYLKEQGDWDKTKHKIQALKGDNPVEYQGGIPENSNALGLEMLGVSGCQILDKATYENIKSYALKNVRGTVQADILKEDQAQNTCIFSTPFALKMMADVQESFIQHQVKNYYSVSISGYHIAEAGANPITQLAFTLSNGFTLVEYYLSRGMAVDDFAGNLSFFFSNGMDPEYSVIGRVARRIWARAMKHRYGASERSQKLKYHIQTSGRSLHAQEMQFNDIRTTLQALYALFDQCNSLHTNAYDEALTTPTEESVRRAMAIQMIINKEMGLNQCENPLQGAYVIEQLTNQVEEAVYQEFDRINQRGGVLGAMETMYQRGKIQDESMVYEKRKHDGSLPIVGVNYFKGDESIASPALELMRSSEEEKQQQIFSLNYFQSAHISQVDQALQRLQDAALKNENLFECLMETVQYASLGEISESIYRVGGAYRRSM